MRTDGIWFKDETGRTLLLRGVNLSGSSKLPAQPNGATYRRDRFFEHREVSFVGRPFPLDEADEHFSRLRAWGLTLQLGRAKQAGIDENGTLTRISYWDLDVAVAQSYAKGLFDDMAGV
jgi:hypothetical protein